MPLSDNESHTLLMAFDREEKPLGLLLDDKSGMFTRADGHWLVVTPSNGYFNGAEIVEVEEGFLDFFDKLDAKGSEPTYKQVLAYRAPEETVTA